MNHALTQSGNIKNTEIKSKTAILSELIGGSRYSVSGPQITCLLLYIQ